VSSRLLAIDGLRGIACLGVAVYHLTRYGATAELATEGLPAPLLWGANHGWIGVQFFFVISGFVIAHTLRDAVVDGWYIGNYALRRSLRLDPPYWVTIAGVLALHFLWTHWLNWQSPLDVPRPLQPPLSGWLVVSHVLYIHKLQGFDSLSTGFWTLCIEIQFYLLCVCSLGMAQAVAGWRQVQRRHTAGASLPEGGNVPAQSATAEQSQPLVAAGRPASTGMTAAAGFAAPVPPEKHSTLEVSPRDDLSATYTLLGGLFLPLALLSLWWLSPHPEGEDLVFHHFFLFFSGCLTGWVYNGWVPRGGWLVWQGILGVTLVAEILADDSADGWARCFSDRALKLWAGFLTPLWIDWAARTGRLSRPLPIPGVNAAGRISYSLYLVHFPVAFLITSLVEHSRWAPTTAGGALLVLGVSLLAGIGVASIMFVAIEAPSQRLAAWLRPRPRTAVSTVGSNTASPG